MRGGAIALAKSLNKDFKEEHCIVIPDTNEPNTVFELQKIYNIPNVQKPYKHEMMWGVSQLQELVRSGIIKVLQDGEIADEFEQILYKRDDATGAVLNELDDDLYHGDLEAALRYASRHFCELILGRTQQKKSNYVDPKIATRPQYNTNDVSYDEGVIWD
jgi:tRNA splicing ligase